MVLGGKRRCPLCRAGILAETGVRQKDGTHVYSCGFCGKAITNASYMHISGGGEGMHHSSAVAGFVRDARTGKPIAMAHVCISGGGSEAFTDKSGRYALSHVPGHRSLSMEFTSPGHLKAVHKFANGMPEKFRLDARLEPSKQPLRPGSLREGSSKLEGKVTGPDGKPVHGAVISLFHHERMLTAATGRGGRYKFWCLPAGDYLARVSAYGFSFDRKWVRVVPEGSMKGGRNPEADFRLAVRKRHV